MNTGVIVVIYSETTLKGDALEIPFILMYNQIYTSYSKV